MLVRLALLLICLAPSVCQAQVGVARKAVAELTEWVTKKAAKEGAGSAADRISKEAIEEIVERAAKEGGEVAVEQLTRTVQRHGPEVLLVARNLDELPGVSLQRTLNLIDEVPQCISRLAAGSSGRELAQNAAKYGNDVLLAEVKHPGLGGGLVARLGGHGVGMVDDVDPQSLRLLYRNLADDVATSPSTVQFAELAATRADSFFPWLGRFVEKNPGLTVITSGVAAVLVAHPEVLTGDGEIVMDRDGNPVYVKKHNGLFGLTESLGTSTLGMFRVPVMMIGGVASVGLAVWIGLRLLPSVVVARARVAAVRGAHGVANPTEVVSLDIVDDREP